MMPTTGISYAIVDVFATGLFTGNQAAVVITPEPLAQEVMQNIASELNLPVTAFASPKFTSDSSYTLTWFSPNHELPICGHGTLGAVSVIAGLPEAVDVRSFEFQTPTAGVLKAERAEDGQLQLDFPADDVDVVRGAEREKIANAVAAAISHQGQVKEVWQGRYICVELVMHHGVQLGEIDVDHRPIAGLDARGVTLTAATGNTEGPRFHSRQFFLGGIEDSVCGSAHLLLGVVWSPRFGAVGKPLLASQGGKRQGEITVVWSGKEGREGGRMKLRGRCVTAAKGELLL